MTTRSASPEGSVINLDATEYDWPKRTPDRLADLTPKTRTDLGGVGSGNFGHAGRPGEVGGSGPGDGGDDAKPRPQEAVAMRTAMAADAKARTKPGGRVDHAVKAQNAQALATALVDHPAFKGMTPAHVEEYASEKLSLWASTSGDHDSDAVRMQFAVQDEFKVQDAAVVHLGDVGRWDQPANRTSGITSQQERAFVRAEYERTQAWFKAQGITHVTLARGMDDNYLEPGETTQVESQPASSWSVNPDTAQAFARFSDGRPVVLVTRVPVAQVLSAAVTGRGSLAEDEVIVLGGKHTVRVLNGRYADVASNFMELRTRTRQIVNIDAEVPNADWIQRAKPRRDLGGPGSGNFGHAGRPGEVGGSAEGDGGLPPSTKTGRRIVDGIISSGVGADHVGALYEDDPLDAVATNFNINTVRDADIDYARAVIAQVSQDALRKKHGDTVTAYRGITGTEGKAPTTSLTLSPSTAKFHARKRGVDKGVKAYTIQVDDVLGYSEAIGKGTYAEEEIVVRANTLKNLSVVNLPDISDVSFPEIIGAIAPTVPKRKKRKRALYKGISLSRRPMKFEAQVLSLTEIPKRLDLARDGLVLHADDDALLQDTMQDIASYGAREVLVELTRQGAPAQLADRPVTVDVDGIYAGLLTDRARALTLLREDYEARLGRRRIGAERKAALTREFTDVRRPALLKRFANRAVNEAFAYGRATAIQALRRSRMPTDEFELAYRDESGRFISTVEAIAGGEAIVDAVIQTAVMDTGTCDECAEVDGEQMELGSDRQEELRPPYVKCAGGDHCRCVQIAILADGTEVDVSDVDEDTIE
jgi:hypothetical protein